MSSATNPQPAPPLDLAQFDGFTPGPWRVHHVGADYWTSQVWTDESHGSVMIAETFGANRDANVVLTAAAPALLAECQRLRAREAALVAALKTHDELLEDFLGVDHGEVRADSERRANYHDLRRVAHDARDACALILEDGNNA